MSQLIFNFTSMMMSLITNAGLPAYLLYEFEIFGEGAE